MFFSRRSTQEEYFDSARPAEEVAEFFRSLGRVNRFFDFAQPFRYLVPRMLDQGDCRSVSILDVGAGDGALGKAVAKWAKGMGWDWRVVNLDTSLAALGLNPGGMNVAGSAVQLPFQDNAFDAVLASQMAHHLTERQVKLMLQECWRVSRRAVILCDLHRNLGLYLALRLLFCFQHHPASFRSDALLSVRKAWRTKDLARLAGEAGLAGASVKLYFGARVILRALKPSNGCVRPSRPGSV
ncbi:MAG TPA: methyltransferase domain-containing protein [Verrucomicrobiae bacterium]|nr:methyltransferase domain-containing protein [Verrucomicrobiae bacterium]